MYEVAKLTLENRILKSITSQISKLPKFFKYKLLYDWARRYIKTILCVMYFQWTLHFKVYEKHSICVHAKIHTLNIKYLYKILFKHTFWLFLQQSKKPYCTSEKNQVHMNAIFLSRYQRTQYLYTLSKLWTTFPDKISTTWTP